MHAQVFPLCSILQIKNYFIFLDITFMDSTFTFDTTSEQNMTTLLETAYDEITFSKLAIDLELVNVTVSHLQSFIKLNCNCDYILFKLTWPGDSEGTFWSSSQAATCPSVYHTWQRIHTVPLNAERQAGKLWIPIFIVFGLTRLGIELESTVSVADALSTRPLIC